MTLRLSKIHGENTTSFTLALSVLLLLFLSTSVLAQEEDLFGSTEDDSLLFGDDFDIGGDDFSFDFDDEAETAVGSDGESAEEDDFFGDFEDDADAEDELADTSSVETDEWGFDDGSDYERLITRAAEDEDPLEEDLTDHPLDFRKYVKDTFLEGTGFTFSLYSPQYVGSSLETWYSYLDYSLTTDLPWHITVTPVELSFQIDISSFNFDNTFPSGGDFRGVSIMPIMKADIYGIEIELGAGTYYPSFGALAGIGYSLQYHSIFASAGYRWNWALDVDPIGEAWWLEPRFTVGVKLW